MTKRGKRRRVRRKPEIHYAGAKLVGQGDLKASATLLMGAAALLAGASGLKAAAKSGPFVFRERKSFGPKPFGGRPDFKEPVLKAAERRISAGNYPTSLETFAEEIRSEDFSDRLPEERPAVKTIQRIIRKSDQWPRWRRLLRQRKKLRRSSRT
jgi:hypothetical protein